MDLLMQILYYPFPRLYHTWYDNEFHPSAGGKKNLILYMMVGCALASWISRSGV
jgi:hypothetical protein